MPSSTTVAAAAAAADGAVLPDGDTEEVDRLKKRIKALEMEETKLDLQMERIVRGIEVNQTYLVGTVLRIIFRPIAGVVYPSELKPGDLIGVDKDSHVILYKLPFEHDSQVKAMEVDETSNEHYCGIGGLEKQLVEAIVLPIIHKECFQRLGIHPPKGVLLYGPPGTGKTLVAHAFASQTNATFLKLTGPQLAVKLVGEGARLVRDAFQLAKEKAPCIIFIDEIDAIGSKHFDSGDREVQQTIVELLNQLDGVGSYESTKVIAATNRPEVLDPAFLRSGRLDQKIEQARVRILKIHSRKMDKNPDVNFEELACCTDDFNGAQLKAVCFEAGMLAFHRDATEVRHEDFVRAIAQVKDGNY